MSIQCTIVPVTPYQQNCSIIKCEATGRAAIVDPGGDVERILAAVEQMQATVEKIILTHAHLDHTWDLPAVKQLTGAPIIMRVTGSKSEPRIDSTRISLARPAGEPEPDRKL